ncbi:hypothetical protein AGMMS4952_24570 [Spirochaetia bacterium]|nr:hypothetical protein AGMMS4952_24570 [Spirochaetia bacterium]
MDIIVLEGPKSCGKTSSLGMLYALMANKAGTQILKGPVSIHDKGEGPKDFFAVLDYTGKRLGNKKIAIFTSGDTISLIELGINIAIDQQVDILIAPNSTRKPAFVLYASHTVLPPFSQTINFKIIT